MDSFDAVFMPRKDQKLEPQRDALLADGCKKAFEEKISSREAERGALMEVLDYCDEGTCWWWRGSRHAP
jgi:DNA invertase Pin-like site-specific DNA recombinase